MRAPVALLVCASACGRLQFDPLTDAGGGATGDATCMPGPFGAPVNLGAVNSTQIEFSPTVSANGLLLVFESDRPGSSGYDLWQATRATTADPFSAAVLAAGTNSVQNEYDPSLTADGLAVYQSSDRGGSPRLYRSTSVGPGQWSAPVLVTGGIDTLLLGGPEVSSDETELFYNDVSSTPSLFRATGSASGFGVGTPVSELNSGSDGYPSLSADGLSLYFETKRAGDLDVYVATRPAIGAMFGVPTPVATAAATGVDETDPDISGDGLSLYFSAMLPDSAGNRDLYVVTRSCMQ